MRSPRPLISFSPFDRLALLGPNGAGKTTMLKEFMSLDVREVIENLGSLPKIQCLEISGTSYVSQRGDYPSDLRVGEFWLWHRGPKSLVEPEELNLALKTLKKSADTRWFELSGGEQQYLRLRRSLSEEGVLVWDEAFQHLDLRFRKELSQLFIRRSAVFATHDFSEARKLATHVVIRCLQGWKWGLLADPAVQKAMEEYEVL